MLLEVHERIGLLNLLPTKEDFKALKTIRETREILAFQPDEIEGLNLKNQTTADGTPQVVWDSAKAGEYTKELPIPRYAEELFREKLIQLNSKHELTEALFSLYEKLVIAYA